MNYMNIPNALGVNDTIDMEMEVTNKKEINSVDGADMVTIDSEVTNQEDEVVFEGDMKFLIKNKGEWPEETHP
jgi:acyl dehydratase